MKVFEQFRDAAIERKGGEAALENALGSADHARDISALSDDRILAEFWNRCFRRGSTGP